MEGEEGAGGPQAVARFLRPRSIAIVGMSARAGSAGQVILQSLKLNDFQGDIHLGGRSSEPIDGRPVFKSADELPTGVGLAVFTLPAAPVSRRQGPHPTGIRQIRRPHASPPVTIPLLM